MLKKSPSIGETAQRKTPKLKTGEGVSAQAKESLADVVHAREKETVRETEREIDLRVMKTQLGITGPSLSEVGREVLLRFAQRIKTLIPHEEKRVEKTAASLPDTRLVQALAFVGMQVVAQGAGAQEHGAHQRSGEHHSSHRAAQHQDHAARESSHEWRPIGLGFELIGINSRELAELITDSFPPFVYGHRQISLIKYVAEEAPQEAQSVDGFVPSSSQVWHETARHEHLNGGGQITLRAEAFRETGGVFYGMETNFTNAMGTLVHEIGHSARTQRFFREQAQNPNHLPISAYSEGFLHVRTMGERVDVDRMGGEMQSDLLKDLYFHAPEGNELLRGWSIDRLAQRHPGVDRGLITRNVDQLFALAPGFDWDAGIGRYRKGVRTLYDQFARAKIDEKLLQIPSALRALLPSSTETRPLSGLLTLAEQLTFDSRLVQNGPLQRHYQQYRAVQADDIHTEAARLNVDVPGFAALHAAWEETLEAMMHFQAYKLKNDVVLLENQMQPSGTSDQARQSELPNTLTSIRAADLSAAWRRIPGDQRAGVLHLLQREADHRLHRGAVPGAIAEEARQVLRTVQLRPL
jgi:hypothetical protein